MKAWLIIVLLPVLLIACQNGESAEEESKNENPDKDKFERELDSLGYPDYYTHPEIEEIGELKDILLKADKVLAYNYNKGEENPANMDDENQYLYNLKTNEIIEGAYNKTQLENHQQRELINLVTDSTNYSGEWSGLAGVCYIPHVGFGFFQNDSLISQVSICFMCSGIRTNPYYKSDGLSAQGFERFESFIREIGLESIPK